MDTASLITVIGAFVAVLSTLFVAINNARVAGVQQAMDTLTSENKRMTEKIERLEEDLEEREAEIRELKKTIKGLGG